MLYAQLEHFYYSLIRQGMPEGKKPESWLEAFYYDKIIKREELLASMIAPGEVVHSTLIATYEPERNEYSGVFSKVITLDDLFA